MKFVVVTTKIIEWVVYAPNEEVAKWVAELAANGTHIRAANGENFAMANSATVNITSTKEIF
jgi:hypothetical protein